MSDKVYVKKTDLDCENNYVKVINNKDDEEDIMTYHSGIQEVYMAKYINRMIDFPFVQTILDFEVKDNICEMKFKRNDLENICDEKCISDAKFICYVVIKFIVICYFDHQINHNDLSIRNIMFNHRSRYSFDKYDSYKLPEYVPVIIDFELSQKFGKNKILLDNDKIYSEFNISHSINPLYSDIFKFLASFMKFLSNHQHNISNPDYCSELYMKIFSERIVCKNNLCFILDLDSINEGVKTRYMDKDGLMKYLFD